MYVLNRNAQAEHTISSPLEAHTYGVLILFLVALNAGYASRVFASLEADYSDLDQDLSGQTYPAVESSSYTKPR